MSVTLATAYVEMIPTTRGIEGAVQKQFQPAVNVAEKAGRESGERFSDAADGEVKRSGSRIGESLRSGLTTAAKVTGAAVATVLGVALTKGFGRLTAIENAQAKLRGFGNDAGAVTEIMKNSLASVKGTAFGLDEAATTAATAVSAGIKPGEQLERVLKVVSNSAGAAGTSMSEMGSIFNKVATSGKAQNDVLGQVADRGIDIYGALAKEMGVANDAVFDLASEGKINFETFEKAMSRAAGSAAFEMGKTTTGAAKNLGAALGRLGAGLLGGTFPLIGPLFGKLTGWIDAATEKVGPLATKLSGELATGLGAVWTLLATGDFTKPIFGQEEDSRLVGFLFGVRDALVEVKGGIVAFGAAWKANDGDITSSGFPGFMEQAAFVTRSALDAIGGAASRMWAGLTMDEATRAEFDGQLTGLVAVGARTRAVLDSVQTALGQLDFTSWQGFTASLSTAGGTIGQALGPALESIGGSLKTLWPAAKAFAAELPNIGGATAKLAAVGLQVLTGVLGFLADHVDTLIQWMPAIVAGFVLWKLSMDGLAAGTYAMQAASLAMTPVITLNNILRLTAIRLENQQTAASARSVVATTAATGAENLNAAGRVRNTLATQALALATGQMSVKQVAAGVAARASAAGQWALNAAMTANPIGLIIAGIAALVAGLVWFFTQTELGRDIVQNVWSGIQTAIGAVGDWITNTAMPAIGTAVNAVGDVFTWLNDNAVQPALGFVNTAIEATGAGITWLGQNVVQPIADGIGAAFTAVGAAATWLWQNSIGPVWDFIAVGANAMWMLVSKIFEIMVAVVTKVLGPAISGWWTLHVQPTFDAIGAAAVWLWENGILPPFNFIIDLFQNKVPAAINWLYDNAVKPVFDGIAGAARWVWDSVLNPYFNFWIDMFQNKVPAAANWLYDNAIKPVFDKVGAAGKWIWDTILNPYFNFWIDMFQVKVPAALNFLYDKAVKPVFDAIGNAGKWMWDNVLKPVFDTISDAIQNKIPKAFDTGVQAVKTAWDGLQEIAKAPVRFVIDQVINKGLIDGINGIGKSVGVSPLPHVAMPPGFADGGWTGPGGKNQEAGVVHADEFVIPKDSRRKFEGRFPGYLSHIMRTGSLPGYAQGGLVMPIHGATVSQPFHGGHNGIDFAAPTGTPILAAGPGTVSMAGWSSGGGGNEVHIDHPNGLQTWYAHMSRFAVDLGAKVAKGQRIGDVGSTGNSTGPHLHYMVLNGGWPSYMDPAPYLDGGGEAGKPMNPLSGMIEGLVDMARKALPQNAFTDLAIGAGESVFKGATDWVWDRLSGITDTVRNVWNAISGQGSTAGITPTLYDDGGLLQPGLTLVNNDSGVPEPVMTGKQWDALTLDRGPGDGDRGPLVTFGDIITEEPAEFVAEQFGRTIERKLMKR